ncbi:MAG: DNA-directed RNA polymerase subunit B'' [Candidatus Woesearchaeota archaeon]
MIKNNELIRKYFDENSVVKSDIESFNHFIDKGISEIISEIGDIVPTIIPPEMEDFRIKLDKVEVEKPSIVEADGSKRNIYPSEARLRKISYSAPVFLNVSVHVDGIQRESFRTQIAKIPIMVKSKYCHLSTLNREQTIEKGEDPDDPGGYFILNGNERVLITVEDLASNKMFFERKKIGPSKYVAHVFSERGAYRIPHEIAQHKDGIIYLSFTRFKKLPIISVIKALGLVKDEEIVKAISTEEQFDDVIVNLYNNVDLRSQNDALEYVGKKSGIEQPKEVVIEKTLDNLDRYLLPHLGIEKDNRMAKAYNLAKLVRRFLILANRQIGVDKDHYMNKRLKLSGDLLMDLFRVNVRALVNDLLYNFQRLVKRGKFSSVKIIIRDRLLTDRIKSALATGSWVGGRKGISQNMDRTNFLASLSHLQRVNSLLSASQENFAARALHCTHFGRLCPIETPEGTSIGLRKNIALLGSVTQGVFNEEKLKKTFVSLGLKEV